MAIIAWLSCWMYGAAHASGSEPLTLAIVELPNFTDVAACDALGPAIAGMVSARLEGLTSVRIVEPATLTARLAEEGLDPKGVVDRSTALEVGRIVDAEHVIFGAVVGSHDDTLAVAFRIIEVRTGRIVVAGHVVEDRDPEGVIELVDRVAARVGSGLALPSDDLRRLATDSDRALDPRLTEGDAALFPPVRRLRTSELLDWLAESGDPAACEPVSDRASDRPRVDRADAAVASAVVDAYGAGRLDVRRSVACLGHLDEHLGPMEARAAWTGLLELVRERLRDAGAAVREVALDALASRPAGASFDPRARLRFERAVARLPDSPASRAMLATLELEGGAWLEAPVTPSRLGGFDGATLELVARLHPDPAIRQAAAAEALTREIASAPRAVVGERRDEVFAAVQQLGHWPVPADQQVERISWDGTPRRARIVAYPDLRGGRLAVERADGGLGGSVVDLGGLQVHFEGFDRPVGICPRSGAVPGFACVDPEQISLLHPRASATRGQVVIDPWLGVGEIAAFGRSGMRMTLPLRVHGVRAPLDLEVELAPVQALAFEGADSLMAEVHALNGARRLVAIEPEPSGRRHAAVIDADDAGFSVSSQGDLTVGLHCDRDCRTLERWVTRHFRTDGSAGRLEVRVVD